MSDEEERFYIVLLRDVRHESENALTIGPWRVHQGYRSLAGARGVVTHITRQFETIREHITRQFETTREHRVALGSRVSRESKIVFCRPFECEEITDDLTAQFVSAEATAESAANRAALLEQRLKQGEATDKPPRKRRKKTT